MLDLPGFGTESDRPSPFSIEKIVDDLRARWLELRKDPSESWCLLAVSLGGMVAMNWTSRYSKDFKGLVLINSSAAGVSPVYHRLRPQNYPKIASLFLSKDLESREKAILEMTTNLSEDALRSLARKHAAFSKTVRKKDALAQIVAALRFKTPKSIPVPVMVLGAKGDRLVDVSCSEKIARRFNARIEIHETANHDLATDDGDWIGDKLKDWVQSAI